MTLCSDEVLYLPVTTEITSLPQLTPEGLPLALARRAAEETRMTRAAAELAERGEAVTSRALAQAAHISLNTACTWLRQRETGALESTPALSVLHYSSYSTSDNTATIPTAATTADFSSGIPTPAEALESEPIARERASSALALTPAGVCPAASHQMLWRWAAGAWHCPMCDTSSQSERVVWALDCGARPS